MCVKTDHMNYSERNVLIGVIEKDSLHELKGHKMVFLLITKQSTKPLKYIFRSVAVRLKKITISLIRYAKGNTSVC